VRKFKSKRNAAGANNALAELKKAAASKENLVPLIIAAVEAHATLGEVIQAFKDTFKFLYNNWTAGLTLTIPLGDVLGKAGYTYAKLDLEQAQARLKAQEQAVFLEVSDAVRTLETAAKSVDAYRIARELAEKQLEAEMKKLAVGMSTNYFVLTYQDALAVARSAEMRSLVDYNVALANIAKVTGSTLEERNITLGDYIK